MYQNKIHGGRGGDVHKNIDGEQLAAAVLQPLFVAEPEKIRCEFSIFLIERGIINFLK